MRNLPWFLLNILLHLEARAPDKGSSDRIIIRKANLVAVLQKQSREDVLSILQGKKMCMREMKSHQEEEQFYPWRRQPAKVMKEWWVIFTCFTCQCSYCSVLILFIYLFYFSDQENKKLNLQGLLLIHLCSSHAGQRVITIQPWNNRLLLSQTCQSCD